MLGWMLLLAPDKAFPLARANAQEALKLDQDLAEAHLARAFVDYYYYRNCEEADQGFAHVLELKPSNAVGRWWYAYYLMTTGRRDKGLDQANRALQTDPNSLPVSAGMALTFYYAHDYERVVQQCQHVISMNDSFPLAHLHLGWAYEQQEKYQEALAELRQANDGIPAPSAALILAHTQAKSGNLAGALTALEETARVPADQYISPCQTAAVYVALGELDRALEYLEKGFKERDWSLWWISVDPRFAPLTILPGFRALLGKLGLEAGFREDDRPKKKT